MKRKIAIVLAVAMAAACLCLAGCSGANLTEEDFVFYDENGNITRDVNSATVPYISAVEGEFTSRQITLGSTNDEVKTAYQDVWDSVDEYQIESGTIRYSWKLEETVLEIHVDPSSRVAMIVIKASE